LPISQGHNTNRVVVSAREPFNGPYLPFERTRYERGPFLPKLDTPPQIAPKFGYRFSYWMMGRDSVSHLEGLGVPAFSARSFPGAITRSHRPPHLTIARDKGTSRTLRSSGRGGHNLGGDTSRYQPTVAIFAGRE